MTPSRNTLLRSMIAVVVSAAMLAVGITPVAAESRPGQPAATVLPGVNSTPAPAVVGSYPSGDFTNIPGPTRSTPAPPDLLSPITKPPSADSDFSAQRVSGRDEFSTTYELNGSYEATVLGTTPENVLVDGAWLPVSERIARSETGWSTKVHPLAPQFGLRANDDMSVTNGKYTLTWSLQGATGALGTQLSKPRSVPGPLTYRDALPGVDVRYDVGKAEVKESLILASAPPADATYRWLLSAPGLTVAKSTDGEFVFSDPKGVARFVIPAPVMWDSSGVEGVQEPVLVSVPASVEKVGASWLFTLRPDQSWLKDPARVFPVTIDPSTYWSTTAGPSEQKSYKSDGSIYTNSLHIGNTRQSNTNVYWRGFARYPLNSTYIAGNYVTAAAMTFSRVNGTATCYNGTVSTATATPPTSYSQVGGQVSTFALCGTTGSASSSKIDALDTTIAAWVRAGTYTKWLVFRGNEGSAYSYKQISANLVVVTTPYPSVAGVTPETPVNGATTARMPILEATGTDTSGMGLQYKYEFSPDSTFASGVVQSGWVAPGQYQVPSTLLQSGVHYYYRISVKDGNDGLLGNSTVRTKTDSAWHFVTNQTPAVSQATASPVDEAVVTDLRYKFSVKYAAHPGSSQIVKYLFRVATGADGKTGTVINSGWITPDNAVDDVTWVPPAGALQNGGNYTWSVLTDDGTDLAFDQWVSKFKVDLRLGTSGPSPFDSAGGASINLANGNLALSFASPTVNTMGGPMGMSFSYNSQDLADVSGLTANYYNALDSGQASTTSFTFDNRIPVLTRTDSSVGADWSDGSPGPAVPADYFLAKWSGILTPPGDPSTGTETYTFGATRNGGARVWVNDILVYDHWVDESKTTEWGSTPITLTKGTPVSVRVEYFNQTGDANVALWIKDHLGTAFVVPADWFTKAVRTLPVGWSSSTPINGSSGRFASATVTESAVTLTDNSGSVHIYTAVPSAVNGYRPPAGEYGVVSLTVDRQVVFTDEDGTVYSFNEDGSLNTVTPPADAKKPATPVTVFDNNGVATGIYDPMDSGQSRMVRFVHEGDKVSDVAGFGAADGNSTDSACPMSDAPPEAVVPAIGMLCRIVYPGHVPGGVNGVDDTTHLYYNKFGQLISLVDPGNEKVVFAYDLGRLAEVWSSLVSDWVDAKPLERSRTELNATVFAYDAAGKVVSVTGPAPTASPQQIVSRRSTPMTLTMESPMWTSRASM